MNPATTPMRSGLSRGLIELRQAFDRSELINQLLWPVLTLTAVFFLRNKEFQDSGFELGTLVMPGVLGMFIALGMLLMIQYLTVEREDGTLLRAKALPHGIRAYFLGKLVTTSGSIVVYLAILLIPGTFIVDGLRLDAVSAWLTLAWVLALGLVATQSIGAVLGALVSNPRAAGAMSVPVMGLIGISGIFYPITSMPDWLQWVAQVFPVYWLGLGMRSALLPEDMVVVEINDSWRHLETLGVLSAWAALGLILAPLVLGRMARRQSGARVAEYREKALQRTG
ncbi:ABC-2 family transporter protein [Streptomyces sp. YIM 121038]|uniref:ABC transporter permease n=1 Tax=Streptomyces sp. YIM 121038 TaxID=2136401 RepID=UPI001110BE45|nr:ABC transporter permease [Streptomyces sp. YIM 121038]QCX80657.1 ABC-2 family transporter protein [Streptomyces sp. YIM 121038]